MTVALRLSAIDLMWPGDLGRLVPALDRLGYHRYWATEHHTREQSGSPTVIATLALSLSRRMRIGTAGVLLNLAAPPRIAADFHALALFFGDRIDLGVTGAIPGGALGVSLLDGRAAPDADGFAQRVSDLVSLMRGECSSQGVDGAEIGPENDGAPALWLCSMSARGAELAGRLGISFAFHDYEMAHRGIAPAERAAIVARYRQSFLPAGAAPEATVVCFGICAESEDAARRRWEATSVAATRPSFLGTPASCRDQLEAVRARYGVDEIVILCPDTEVEGRIASYALLAESVGLRAADQAA